jgi:allophycocyanin beta subunit
MQDAITSVINSSDVQGKYLDSNALDKLKAYFGTGELRVRAAGTISANAATIVKEAVAKSLLYSDITRPGGNMYTTRRYAACIRDLDYYLRYATYAMQAIKEVTASLVGADAGKEMGVYLDYICSGLG